MSEEILKVELVELLQCIRVRRPDGTVVEVGGVEAMRNCYQELRNIDQRAGDELAHFFNLADQITGDNFQFTIEFAVKVR